MAIITLEEYKTWATINSPNQDSRLTPMIEAASIMVEKYLDYSFTIDGAGATVPVQKTKKFVLYHGFQDEFLLPDTDTTIVSITPYIVNPTASSISQAELSPLEEEEYLIEEDIGLLRVFRKLYKGWGLTVVYDTSKTPDEAIKMACCMLVDYWKDSDFKTNMTQGGMAVTQTPVRVLPKHIEAILNTYRKI